MNCSPSGSSVWGILQTRMLEWVAISFSNAWKWKVKVKSLSRVWLLATPWTYKSPGGGAHQAPPSMGFSRQEYWSGSPVPSPRGSAGLSLIPGFCWSLLNYVHSVPNLQLPLPTRGSPSLWSGGHGVIEVLAPSVEVPWKQHLNTILQL